MKETEKMLEIIHENCKRKQERELIKAKKQEKKEKNHRRLELVVMGIALIAVIILGHLYNEKSVKGCMEAGHTENFCRYAGE